MADSGRSRRADILAAAEHEFAAAGYSGARMERIAAAAAVNKQLLFHYFGSKEGLFAAALAGLLAPLEPAPTNTSNSAAELRMIITTLQAGARTLPGLVGIVADSNANPDFPDGPRETVRSWLGRTRQRLVDAVADGQRRGYFRDDIDPAGVGQLALAAVLGAGAADGEPDPPVASFIADHCAWR